MNALITGAYGFCGRHLGARLRGESGVRTVGLDRVAPAGASVDFDECLVGDLDDADGLDGIVRRVEPKWVFHLAGLARGSDRDIYRANLQGAVNLLEAVRRHVPGARVLVVGSAAEYGRVTAKDLPIEETQVARPEGAYGISKYGATLAALDYARRYALQVVVARPFNAVGAGIPPALVVGAVLERAKVALEGPEPRVVKVGHLDTERDFVAVEDIVEAYWRMLQVDAWGEVFNLCSGEPRSIRAVVTALLELAGPGIRLEVDPGLVRPTDVPVAYGSCRKASEAFGFKAQRPLAQALRAAWDHVMRASSQSPQFGGE